MNIFGFEIKRKKEPEVLKGGIIPPNQQDGSAVIESAGGYFSHVYDFDAAIRSEQDLIRRYRDVSQLPEVDSAIEDIVNEAIISDDSDKIADVNMEEAEIPDTLKEKIREEFDNVCSLLKFEDKAHDIFRTWYVDGKIDYFVVLDEQNLKKGIKALQFIDPRKIKRIKEVEKTKDPLTGVEMITAIKEYFVFNDKGLLDKGTSPVKIGKDSVIEVTSGLYDQNTQLPLSYLHKAMKAANQLKMIEDSLIIYRVSRSPERRVFYIDTGDLPKQKAEQYVQNIMNRYKNKVVYDAKTGEISNDRAHLSMMEDFWMPRREGGKGTEIQTLQGGSNLGDIEDVNYFKKNLYQALNVPVGRLEPQSGFSLGRSSEISREEVKFSKFVNKLRKRFSQLLLQTLRIQLITKKIMTVDEWDEHVDNIRIQFNKDNFYYELKQNEILNQRLGLLNAIQPYVGIYYSQDYVKKQVLFLNEEEVEEMEKQIDKEGMPPPVPGITDGSPIYQDDEEETNPQGNNDGSKTTA